MLPDKLFNIILEDAKKDDELLELQGFTKDSPKCDFVATYLCNYLPVGVNFRIAKRYKNRIQNKKQCKASYLALFFNHK